MRSPTTIIAQKVGTNEYIETHFIFKIIDTIPTSYLRLLYLCKTQTTLIYDQVARDVKGFSESLFKYMMECAAYDRNHVASLHHIITIFFTEEYDTITNKTYESDAKIFAEPAVGIVPYIVFGGRFAEKIKRGDEDALKNMLLANLSSLIKIENDMIVNVNEIKAKYHDIEDALHGVLSVDGIILISTIRLRYLREYYRKIENYSFFTSETPIFWRCLYCGIQIKGTQAPEQCSCCSSARSWFA